MIPRPFPNLLQVVLCAPVAFNSNAGIVAPPPTPSPSSFPRLTPDGTAAANLEPVLQLEHASGRSSRLIAVSGVVNGQGRLAGPDPWHYSFRQAGDVAGAVHPWRVDVLGSVSFEHPGVCDLAFSEDLSGGPGLCSERVIDRAPS